MTSKKHNFPTKTKGESLSNSGDADAKTYKNKTEQKKYARTSTGPIKMFFVSKNTGLFTRRQGFAIVFSQARFIFSLGFVYRVRSLVKIGGNGKLTSVTSRMSACV